MLPLETDSAVAAEATPLENAATATATHNDPTTRIWYIENPSSAARRNGSGYCALARTACQRIPASPCVGAAACNPNAAAANIANAIRLRRMDLVRNIAYSLESSTSW